jgi:hypothetical protein
LLPAFGDKTLQTASIGGYLSMNVTADQFKAYLESFHSMYRSKIIEVIPEESRSALLRWHALQNATIAGYVSTMHGAGYQYVPADTAKIDVAYGSARVETHLFGCSPKDLDNNGNVVVLLSGRDFKMVSCSADGRLPVKLDGNDASATLVDVTWVFRGRSGRLAYAKMQVDRSVEAFSTEKAVERAMDEVLRAAIDVMATRQLRTSLGDFLRRFKNGHVLLLGDFSDEGRVRLQEIKNTLGKLGYYALTLDEVQEPASYDLRHKLTAVASVCRFVIIDDSSKGGQAAELPIVESVRATAVVLRRIGSDSTFVTRGLGATSKVIREYDYENATLSDVLITAVGWAENTIADLEREYSRTYPWRPSADEPAHASDGTVASLCAAGDAQSLVKLAEKCCG